MAEATPDIDYAGCPRFFDLLAVTRKAMGRGNPSPRDVIAKGIKPA